MDCKIHEMAGKKMGEKNVNSMLWNKNIAVTLLHFDSIIAIKEKHFYIIFN